MLTSSPTTSRSRKLGALVGLAGATLAVGLIAPATAAPGGNKSVGRTDAAWDASCATVQATSTKDISNIVYVLDGVTHRIEFGDGTSRYALPGEVTELWVKAGNNKSGHGSGYGQHYTRPDRCDDRSDNVSF